MKSEELCRLEIQSREPYLRYKYLECMRPLRMLFVQGIYDQDLG